MKHQEAILEICIAMHESWMDEEEKDIFNKMVIADMGEDLEKAFEDGLKQGISVEDQKRLAIEWLKTQRAIWPKKEKNNELR